MRRAFTRAVSNRISQCELTHLERVPIDWMKASEQHARYEAALAAAGLEVVRLPDLPDDADAVFVEDTALLLDGHAVITRPGAASRAGETQSTAEGLSGAFEMHWVEEGHVDGGDVLRIGLRLYVGLSTRTNLQGIGALRRIVRPLGFEVVEAELQNCLHLKSSATFAGIDASGTPVLVYDEKSVDPRQFAAVEPLAVAADEPTAANCLRAAGSLLFPAGNPKTAAMLRSRGFELVELDVSELQKAESGLTCMSLIDDRS